MATIDTTLRTAGGDGDASVLAGYTYDLEMMVMGVTRVELRIATIKLASGRQWACALDLA